MDVHRKKQRGDQAEKLACDYLCRQGLQLITQNYQCKTGEIDLIMQDGEDIVFVEVRLRLDERYGNAIETVTKHKQRKIIRTALHFLQSTRDLNKLYCRFDVIGFSPHLEWIKEAFTADVFS